MSSKFLAKLIEPLIVDLMRQSKIPGLAIGIIKEGKPFYSKGFGARDLKKNIPMDVDTLFGIGSMSKSFTSFAVMQLVEQGKIDLQAPVKKYIDFKLGDKKNPIKIHHLLSHSSGFPELHGTIVNILKSLGSYEHVVPMSDSKDFMLHVNGATAENVDEPDKVFLYNNDMFACLGLIVESVTGMKFEEYVRKNIFKPLNMNRTTYLREDYENDDNAMLGYLPLDEKGNLKPSDPPFDRFIYAPGGILSSINELQKYLIALMDGGKVGSNQIIQESSISQMWTPYNKTPEGTSYGSGENWYCYGWMKEKDFFGYEVIHHGGNVLTSSAMAMMIPELKMGVVIGINRDGSGLLGPLAHGILAILLGKDLNEAVPLLKAQATLSKIVGEYAIYKGLQTLTVTLEDMVLYATFERPLAPKPQKFPIAVDDFEDLKFHIPMAIPGITMKGQAFIHEDTGKVDIVVDRYHFHKIRG